MEGKGPVPGRSVKRRNIALTVNFSPWSVYSGGGQRATHELAGALARRGHSVTVIYTKALGERLSFPDDLPYAVRFAAFIGLRSRRQAPLRPLNAFTVARAVDKLAREGGLFAVHSQGEEGARIPRLQRRHSFSFVVTPRYPSYPPALISSKGGWPRKVVLNFFDAKHVMLGRAVRDADACCPTSRASLEQVQRAYGVPGKRCVIVPNGVAPCCLEVERANDAHRGPIIFFGRFAASKGIHVLVEALGILGPQAPHAVFVGRGEARGRLRKRLIALGLADRSEILDWRPIEDIAALLARASLAVLPSLEESFGNTIVEAMAAGTPLISTLAGSIPEVAIDGRTAILVPPNDPEALAKAILALGRNPDRAEEMGRAARSYVRDHFSWEATAARFEAVYESCAARRQRCAS